MDPSYQQAMIQALMGQQSMPAGTTGQNPTSPYGQGFITGNMMMPSGSYGSNTAAMGAQAGSGAGAMNSSSPLTTGPSTMLSQPTSTMSY